MLTALSPISDPLPGYFFTWTWRHRVRELARGCCWVGGREGPGGQAWRGRHPPFLPLHRGASSPFPPTGTAGLTPSPPSGFLMSSTSVPMRECHPRKGGAEDGGWSRGPRPVLSRRPHPGAWAWSSEKCHSQPSFLWSPQEWGPAPSPRPPRPETPRPDPLCPFPKYSPTELEPHPTEHWALPLHHHC